MGKKKKLSDLERAIQADIERMGLDFVFGLAAVGIAAYTSKLLPGTKVKASIRPRQNKKEEYIAFEEIKK